MSFASAGERETFDGGLNQADHWKLTPLKKYSRRGVVRAVEPRVTIRRARESLKAAGITKVAEITGLDRVGIPNFITVRPRDLDSGISYYNGKGTTRADAHAGALMEAIERHGGEHCDYEVTTASYRDLRRSFACVRPDEIIVPMLQDYSDDLELEWVCGYDLLNAQPALVPLNAVICPYQPVRGEPLFYASTNGLASGNTLIEALCHAICEIIERDAQAVVRARTEIRPLVRGLLGMECDPEQQRYLRRISLTGLPMRAERLVAKLTRAGINVDLRDLTSTAGVATIDCAILERKSDGSGDAYGGCGCHPDARVALLRAITEAAQSRLAFIQGGREDLPQIMRHKTVAPREDLSNLGPLVSFDDLPSYEHEYIDEDVKLLLRKLPEYGISQVVAFDMTRPEVGIPVVRVVIPRAETWTVFHLHTGRGTFGPRISQEL